MKKKHLIVSGLCTRCNQGGEDAYHIFKEWPIAKEVWRLMGINFISQNQNRNMAEWLICCFKHCSMPQRISLCCCLWSLWYARNKYGHEKMMNSAIDIYRFVCSYLREIEEILFQALFNVHQWKFGNHQQVQKWK